MSINEELQKFESLYKKLMTEDNTPDDEANAKMELLEILSNIEALIGNLNSDLKNEMENVKELLLSWDPYGPWFKEQRDLVKFTYNLITSIKKHKYSIMKSPTQMDNSQPAINELKREIQNIKAEFTTKFDKINSDINNIKKSITLIVKSIQSGQSIIKSPAITESSLPEIETSIKPVPIAPPISDTINNKAPKPVQTGSAQPKPVPILSAPPKPVPTTLLDKKSQKIETKTDKDTLFNIFSGKEVENTQVGANETPSPQQTPQNTLFKVLSAPDDQIIKPTPTPITIYPDEESGESEVIELTVDNEKEEKTTESIDPETLYQELINLEGKRYSLERSIRDLKRDRNSGKMSDNEYKSKLNKLLKDLKSISNRIEEIRENLD